MDDIGGGSAQGNFGAIFGSFASYMVVERIDMRIQRLVERFAPNIGFLATARVGGQVIRRDAFRLGVVAA